MVNARARPIKRIPRGSNLLRDLIRSREADSIDIFRQHVRITPHFLNRLLPIGLEDSYRPAGAHTMAVQEEHDCFASCQVCEIRSWRLGPIPSTDSSSATRTSMTSNTSAPNRPTSFFARTCL